MEKIQTIALDTSSMTSVALSEDSVRKVAGAAGELSRAWLPNVEQMLATHDAGLLIGDPALQVDRSRYLTLDLAEEWIRYTGKPFVFAFWAVRSDALREASPVSGLGADISGFPRPRTRALKPQRNRARMGAAARTCAKTKCAAISPKTSTTNSTPAASRACNFSTATPPKSARCRRHRRLCFLGAANAATLPR